MSLAPVGHLPQKHNKAFPLNPLHLKIQIKSGSDPTGLKTWMSWFLETKWELLAIHVAVSSLSPVNIQIWNMKKNPRVNIKCSICIILAWCLGVHIFLAMYCMCTLIPALRRSSSVGLTSACSWSSTPVRHRSSISLSRLSTAAATFRARSWILNFAWLYRLWKWQKWIKCVLNYKSFKIALIQ